jgi:hypothetical protein
MKYNEHDYSKWVTIKVTLYPLSFKEKWTNFSKMMMLLEKLLHVFEL